ncbi:MAG: ABC transporter ATP-binding protein [Candidatus Kapaibacterium sp.]
MAKRRTPAPDSPKLTPSQQRTELRFILSFYADYKWRALIVLFIMLLSNSISLAFPKFIGDLLDTIQHSALTMSMWSLTGILVILFVVQALVNYFTSVSLATITENVLARLRSRVFDHILRLPLGVFSERRVGELMSRVTSDITQIQETFTFTMMQLLRQSIFLVGGIVFIVIRSVRLTTPVLITLPLIIFIALVFGRRLRAISTQVQDILAGATTIVEETFQAIESVKSYTNEAYEHTRYRNRLSEYVLLAIKAAKIRSVLISFILFAMFGGIAGVLAYGVYLVRLNELTIGELLSFILYAFFVAGALGSFAELFGQIQRTLGASVRVREILNEQPEDSGARDDMRRLGEITISDVSFRYPSRDEVFALNDVSLHIPAGARVAFVGESGAGKSTTAALIQRLYEPTSGSILFDGVPARTLSLHTVRSNIGFVPQDIVLFGSTIEENIRYGNVNAAESEVLDAARHAYALEFIEKMPEGMATVVGERGVKLSGGQRQRIAIARALLKNPPILILDEATSSLDSQSEHYIQQALEHLMSGRTTIVIAHRLSTIRRCDRIFVFHNGGVAEQGTHDQLIADTDSRYARLCRLQFGGTDPAV